MSRTRVFPAVAAACCAIALVTTSSGQPAGATTPGRQPRSDLASAINTKLTAVAALSSDDVWAVGERAFAPFVKHFDGTSWKVMHTGLSAGRLSDVLEVAPDNVWAVGQTSDVAPSQGIIVHWDGASWTQMPSPGDRYAYNQLLRVTATSAHGVYATGWTGPAPSGEYLQVVERWNGKVWKVDTSAPLQTATAVSGASPTDGWAVGTEESRYTNKHGIVWHQARIEHWNGDAWQSVTTPNPGYQGSELDDVSAIADDDAWVVGVDHYGKAFAQTPLALHWDGSEWSQVLPQQEGFLHGSYLQAVSAEAANDVWAVGRSDTLNQTLVEHWDGASWSVVSTPSDHFANAGLTDVVAISPTDAWAVGSRDYETAAVLMHWDGTAWTVVR